MGVDGSRGLDVVVADVLQVAGDGVEPDLLGDVDVAGADRAGLDEDRVRSGFT
eukprot:gene21482-25804_t